MEQMIENLKRQLMADKKKLGIMLVLVAVGLLMWGRLLLKEVPKTATATPVAAAAAAPTAAEAAQDALLLEEARYGVTVVMSIPRDLPRDLFALDTTDYVKVKSGAPTRFEPKPESDTPDREFRTARAVKAAGGLRLEGIILGDEASVIINGQLLQEGQRIEEFTVFKIEERRVVLEFDGIHIRMSM